MNFRSPFETNVRLFSGWRWYARFLADHPAMVRDVECDTWECLGRRGLVWC